MSRAHTPRPRYEILTRRTDIVALTFIYSSGLRAADSLLRRITQIADISQRVTLPLSSSYARLLATSFATGGGLRKFMGFLHEITRKHNPCPLRRMSPQLQRLHSFRPLPRLVSPFLFCSLRPSALPLAFADRSIAKLADRILWNLTYAFLHICRKYNEPDDSMIAKLVSPQTD